MGYYGAKRYVGLYGHFCTNISVKMPRGNYCFYLFLLNLRFPVIQMIICCYSYSLLAVTDLTKLKINSETISLFDNWNHSLDAIQVLFKIICQ